MRDAATNASPKPAQRIALFRVFLWLGLTSFGGPIAHISHFRREFVERRRWFTEEEYAGWVGLCQFLPGPASSQLGFCLGMVRGGVPGAIAAFLGFTLPSALFMGVLGGTMQFWTPESGRPLVHGLKLVAVAVVAHGVVTLGRRLCPDPVRGLLAVVVTGLALGLDRPWIQPLLIAGAAGVGAWACRGATAMTVEVGKLPYGRRGGIGCLIAFGFLVAVLPLLAMGRPGLLSVAAGFSRAGALVFGGGHVVLPLLEDAVVRPGWVSQDDFLAGYGAAQAVPGPMFTLAAFLGARLSGSAGGWVGASIGVLSIFLPGLLLVAGVLPFWHGLTRSTSTARMMAGVNAGVVGLLAAALYDPVWTGAVRSWTDGVIAVAGFAALMTGRVPVLLVVLGCVVAGASFVSP